MIKILFKYLWETYGPGKNGYIPPIKFNTKKPSLNLPFPAISRPWSGLVLHHSAAPDGITRDVDSIARYHTSWRIDGTIVTQATWEARKKAGDGKLFEKPWGCIGYHFLIERVGEEVMFHFGRPLSKAGAHAGHSTSNYYNDNYLGLCVVGNYDLQAPDQELFSFTLQALRSIIKHFGFTKQNVIGHREVYPLLGVPVQKQCPGKLWDMNLTRETI